MHDDIDRLVKKAIPLFAVFIACIGGSCFTVFAPVETVGHSKAIQYTVAGMLGTLAVAERVWRLSQLPPDEDFFGLRSRLIAFLLCVCWCIGAIGGFILFYWIPRHVV